jgi:hypothetical protein
VSAYIVYQDIFQFLPAAAIPAFVTTAMLTQDCVTASGVADSKMRARYALPLVPNFPADANHPGGRFDPVLELNVTHIAIWLAMTTRGFAVGSGADSNFRTAYEDAVAWFDGVERGNTHPDVVQQAVVSPRYNLPQIISKPPRGI